MEFLNKQCLQDLNKKLQHMNNENCPVFFDLKKLNSN